MKLRDEIARLCDEVVASLDASHDYYVHTKAAWQLVRGFVDQGQRFTIRNRVTGNTVNESELSVLAEGYVAGFLASATFQQFVSLFERFIFELLRLWLIEYPGNLAGNQLRFRTVLDSPDKEAIVDSVVLKEVHGLAYQRIADWFDYLEKIAKLGCPQPDQIERLAEIKTSRDVLVHNSGIANAVYIDKSMGRSRFGIGDVLELPEQYHRESWQLIKQVIDDLSQAAISKLQT